MRFLTATTLSILILAILLGLAAAYGIRNFMRPAQVVKERPPEMVNLPMAAVDLPEGRTLVLGDMILMPTKLTDLKDSGWSREVLRNSGQILGRTLKKKLAQGEPFRPTDFYLQGQGPDYLSDLPEGYRAVSVTVPLANGGYALPGQHVDVVFRSTPVEGDETTPAIPDTTITLAENLKVLAAERARPPSGTAGGGSGGIDLRNSGAAQQAIVPTIILAATPKQANALQAVTGRGQISLISRPEGEASFGVRPAATSLEDILGLEPPLAPVLPPPPFVTTIYRGTSASANAFDVSNPGQVLPLGSSPNQPTN